MKRAKKIVVFHPPPTFHERYVGTSVRREMRRIFEKPSVPAASAGRGAFLIDGYYIARRERLSNCPSRVRRRGRAARDVQVTYGGRSHTTIFKFLESWGRSLWGFDELEFALRAIHALRLGRHDAIAV